MKNALKNSKNEMHDFYFAILLHVHNFARAVFSTSSSSPGAYVILRNSWFFHFHPIFGDGIKNCATNFFLQFRSVFLVLVKSRKN